MESVSGTLTDAVSQRETLYYSEGLFVMILSREGRKGQKGRGLLIYRVTVQHVQHTHTHINTHTHTYTHAFRCRWIVLLYPGWRRVRGINSPGEKGKGGWKASPSLPMMLFTQLRKNLTGCHSNNTAVNHPLSGTWVFLCLCEFPGF